MSVEPLSLWDRPQGLARRTDPQTSHDAARSVDPSGQWAVTLGAIARLGEANRYELSLVCALDEQQLSRRLSELAEMRRIELTGATRAGASGRQQRVWRLAAPARS